MALKAYTISIKINPREHTTFSNRALVYIKMEKYSKALQDANTAIKLNPNFMKAYYRRATVYRLQEASKDYQYIL